MLIAIPVTKGLLFPHFGHCERFSLYEVDPTTKTILKTFEVPAPPHEPGLLPSWLAERGVNLVVCGGIGARALDLFAQEGIDVIPGAPPMTPEALIALYLAGTLKTEANSCSHD